MNTGLSAIVLFTIFLFAPRLLFALEIRTANGAVYRNARVSRVEPDGVVIIHAYGVVKIPFTELSNEIQQKYHYDPKQAQEYERRHHPSAELLARPASSPEQSVAIPSSPASPTASPSAIPSATVILAGRKLPNEIIRAVVTISGPFGDGTGFVCSYRGRPYVATNQHVLGCGGPMVIRTSSGETLFAKAFLAAVDADIVLIQCESIPSVISPLKVAVMPNEQIHSGDDISVPGNSQGHGVITETPGKLLAIGPQRVETDTPIYHGNSGSPIVHQGTNEVVGILTKYEHIELDKFEKASFKSKDSAIKTEYRVIGYRIDAVQTWENLNWFTFQETQQRINQAREELIRIFAYFTDSSPEYKKFKELHTARNNAAMVYN
jgi:hypothetical protein